MNSSLETIRVGMGKGASTWASRSHWRAHMALVLGEGRAGAVGHVLAGERVPGLVLLAVEVGGGEHGVHAGQGDGGGDVDADDARTCVRAAHEAGVQHPRPDHVVDERAVAGEQPGVLHPVDACTRVPGGAGGEGSGRSAVREHGRGGVGG